MVFKYYHLKNNSKNKNDNDNVQIIKADRELVFFLSHFWLFFYNKTTSETIQMDKTHQRQADAAVWSFKTVHSGDVKRLLKGFLQGGEGSRYPGWWRLWTGDKRFQLVLRGLTGPEAARKGGDERRGVDQGGWGVEL